ncbi:MAG: homoserine O-acetyltransferase [Gammaproteobacteria bacterium]|nr:homoserine O-acetyltransferase [Gammaproteobacteria bacterium]
MSNKSQIIKLSQQYKMYRGGSLPETDIAYETWGELNPQKDNAVLLFTGLSPSAHAASSPEDPAPGWWEEMVGEGKPIDSSRFHIICVNSLGSCFGSTGPASAKPGGKETYGVDFPVLSIEDIAATAHAAVTQMGIERVKAVVGPSMGGMSALAYNLMFPGAAENFVSISSAAHALPLTIAIRSLQRELIRSDPAWNGGRYASDEQPVSGMRLARKLGMISYRSAEEWKQRFSRERVEAANTDELFPMEFQVESYLTAHANKFVGGFDANCYQYLSHAMDLFDAAEHGESLEDAFRKIKLAKALVIGVTTDFLFPLEQQQELAELLTLSGASVELAELESLQGHDSFLADFARFGPAVAGFFNKL